MKKLILAFATIAITAGAYAQAETPDRKMSPRDPHNNQYHNTQTNPADKTYPDGVMMKDGKILAVNNGQFATLEEDLTLGNGTRIMTDGNYTTLDGTTKMLKEGQHIDLEGNLVFHKSEKDRNMYLVPDSTKRKDY